MHGNAIWNRRTDMCHQNMTAQWGWAQLFFYSGPRKDLERPPKRRGCVAATHHQGALVVCHGRFSGGGTPMTAFSATDAARLRVVPLPRLSEARPHLSKDNPRPQDRLGAQWALGCGHGCGRRSHNYGRSQGTSHVHVPVGRHHQGVHLQLWRGRKWCAGQPPHNYRLLEH